MEKLKSVFSPGSKADDDVLYGEGGSNNLGKVAGEGSHFGHSRTTDPSESTTGSANAPADSTTTGVSKPGATNTGNSGMVTGSDIQSPSTDATKAAQLASKPHDQETQRIPSSNTQDPKGTTAALAASRADASHQKDTLPDRTVGATGNTVSQAGSEHPIFDQFASGAKDESAHPQQHTAKSAADTAASTSTGYSNPYSSHAVDPRVDPSARQAPKDHHIERDVGLGGATAGAAVYEGNKLHGQHKPTTQSSVQPSQSTLASNDPISGTSGSAQPTEPQSSSKREEPPVPKGTTATPYDPNTGSATYSTGDSRAPQQGQHHYGRDAALGAGAGALGVGGYEATKHHDPTAQPQTSSTVAPTQFSGAAPMGYDSQRVQQPTTGASYYTAPQGTAVAGKESYDTQRADPPTTGAGSYTAPYGTAVGNEKPAEHHYGRDAAVGAGTGAAGIGGYEALKHRDDNSQRGMDTTTTQQRPTQEAYGATQPTSTGYSAPGQAITTDTRQPAETAKEPKADDHHYGRDAAIGAGVVGAGGAAAYEAKKHEDEKKALEQQQQAQKEHQKQLEAQQKEQAKEQKQAEKEHEKAVKEHEKEVKKEEKKHEKEVKKEQKEHEKAVKKEEKEHEKEIKAAEAEREKQAKAIQAEQEKQAKEEEERRRKEKEAAGAAGLGAVGLAAGEHERRKDEDDEDEKGEGKKKGGLLSSLLHRNKKDKDTDGAEQEEPKDHHREKEATAGAGVVGAGALGKHEYDQYKEHDPATSKEVQRTDTTESDEGKKKGGLLGGLLHRNKKDKDTDYEEPKDHHRGKEAAVGGGAVGAAAFGKHEYDEHRQAPQDTQSQAPATSQQYQPTESQKYPPSQAYQTQPSQPAQTYEEGDKPHHYKEAAAGAGVLGAGAIGKYEYDQHHRAPLDTSQTQATTVTQPPYQTEPSQPMQDYEDSGKPHHYKEDAAAGAGVLGAGALGKHEYDKRYDTTEQPSQTQPTYGQPSQYTETREQPPKDHHREEVAAGAGAIGAGALGKHEYDQHHGKTDKDIAAEKRNDLPVVGELHREGRFHGKEGGAPGAVGVPPEERKESSVSSQKPSHDDGDHKKHGILGSILHRHKDDKDDKTTDSGSSEGDRHRLHKDPPSDHPAANVITDPTTGLPMDTSKGPHDGRGTDGLPVPHGHHSEKLPDNADVNVQHKLHDPAGMGYGANESGKYNV